MYSEKVIREANDKRLGWKRVEDSVRAAWYELVLINESPMTQATLLGLIDRAQAQQKLWELTPQCPRCERDLPCRNPACEE